MRLLLCLSLILFAQISTAQLPEGRWLNPQLTQDDGAFGKYYQGWLIISDQMIDQITTLGMHYDKIKYQILSDDGSTLRILDKTENVESELKYTTAGNLLTMCSSSNSCTTYHRTLEKPITEPAPSTYPKIHITTKWCIESDCESVTFKGIASEMLYNLNEGFSPVFWQYAAPQQLQTRHGIRLHVLSYSYRFNNNSSDLSSFMTSLILRAESGAPSINILARSGALNLKPGPLSQLEGTFENQKITVDFSIEKTP